MKPSSHAWRPLWVSPPALLAAEMLAEAASLQVDELVDVVLLELLDQYRASASPRRSAQPLHSLPGVQRNTARVISLAHARRLRAGRASTPPGAREG